MARGEIQKLLRQTGPGRQGGAVDVAREGSPPDRHGFSSLRWSQLRGAQLPDPAPHHDGRLPLPPTIRRRLNIPFEAPGQMEVLPTPGHASPLGTVAVWDAPPLSTRPLALSQPERPAPPGNEAASAESSGEPLAPPPGVPRPAHPPSPASSCRGSRRSTATSHDGAVVRRFAGRLRSRTPPWKSEGHGGAPELFFHGDTEFSIRGHVQFGLQITSWPQRPARCRSRRCPRSSRAPSASRTPRILASGTVRVLDKDLSATFRRRQPERIISSRAVRHLKPQPGINVPPKTKSRCCVGGHQDPDTKSPQVCSPTPQTESLMLFIQAALNLRMRLYIAGLVQAFLQRTHLCVRPAASSHATARALQDHCCSSWSRCTAWTTLLSPSAEPRRAFLTAANLQRSLLEPCWWYRRGADGHPEEMTLLDVDDFMTVERPDRLELLCARLKERFRFGCFDRGEADFIGRRIKCSDVRAPSTRRSTSSRSSLPSPQHEVFGESITCRSPRRSSAPIGRPCTRSIGWRESPAPSPWGVVSILASRPTRATLRDVWHPNRLIGKIRDSASRPIIFWPFDPEAMSFISMSDAGKVGGGDVCLDEGGRAHDSTQGAWLVVSSGGPLRSWSSSREPLASWRSTKLKQRVPSMLAGKALSISAAISEVEWMQRMYRDVRDVRRSALSGLAPFLVALRRGAALPVINSRWMRAQSQAHVVDARSVFDVLQKDAVGSRQDRRTPLKLAIPAEALRAADAPPPHWVPHARVPADPLTKEDCTKVNSALDHLIRTGMFGLSAGSVELVARHEDEYRKSRT